MLYKEHQAESLDLISGHHKAEHMPLSVVSLVICCPCLNTQLDQLLCGSKTNTWDAKTLMEYGPDQDYMLGKAWALPGFRQIHMDLGFKVCLPIKGLSNILASFLSRLGLES